MAYVYSPLEYAWDNHRIYLDRFGARPREAVLIGMNPGPWGMMQTGVPFGDASMVRDWLGIVGSVDQPRSQHPARPVLGFDCARGEVRSAAVGVGATAVRHGARILRALFCVELLPAGLS
ncbi:MAG: hypothetical protein ACR2KU_00200 [Gammaproteobacteria bacterium]